MLESGNKAPNFVLPSTINEKISLSDLKGKPVILVFYPADNTPVCSSQLSLYNEIKSQGLFDNYNAELLGISVDNLEKHQDFSRDLDLSYPLLADNNPEGEVTKKYGIFDEKNKTSQRALFVIDPQGIISWSYLSPIGDNPGAEGILDALDSLNN
ncbi:MAG: putative peroxiredoxin bcp [Candidatus Heimdallarchaeota archaeon LC_3]|nr:MAG: putative peroxiredoxin bcp [Candidatus Heimdallarchaeota archaeon LC_3]